MSREAHVRFCERPRGKLPRATRPPSESWFSTIEFECRAVHEFSCLEHAEQIIGEYIEGFYDPRRLHSALGFSSPVEFEISFNLSNSAA